MKAEQAYRILTGREGPLKGEVPKVKQSIRGVACPACRGTACRFDGETMLDEPCEYEVCKNGWADPFDVLDVVPDETPADFVHFLHMAL